MKTAVKVDPSITFDHMHSDHDEMDVSKINQYQRLSWILVGIEMICIAMLLGFMFIML